MVANSQCYAEGELAGLERRGRELELIRLVLAAGFYSKLGYVVEGDTFLEDGDPHIRMTKSIKLSL